MGFFISVLYFVTYYFTPTLLFGPLAAFHVELILAVVVTMVSLLSLSRSLIFKTPQSIALIGLGAATLLSVMMTGWFGGALARFLIFIPNAFAYFLICLHCKSRNHMKVIVSVMFVVCAFVIAHGVWDLKKGVPQGSVLADGSLDSDSAPAPGAPGTQPMHAGSTNSKFFMAQRGNEGEWIFRLKGLGEVADPNDFAQLCVCTIPLLFIFWKKKKSVRNFVLVLVPVGVLLYGLFMTHSRSSMLAVLAMLLVALRRKIGIIPSLLLAGVLLVGAQAMHFSGDRDISASAGSDRAGLWGQGLAMFKMHPILGVGYGNFSDNAGLTAHNSVVVCVAELGFVGLYFWCLFLLPTGLNLWAAITPEKVMDGVPVEIETSPNTPWQKKPEAISKEELIGLARILFLSLTGFLVCGWFLSRAFVMTLFLLGGMAEVVYQMGLDRGMFIPRQRADRILGYTLLMAASLVVVVYIMVLLLNRLK